jgi:hypothetical protein
VICADIFANGNPPLERRILLDQPSSYLCIDTIITTNVFGGLDQPSSYLCVDTIITRNVFGVSLTLFFLAASSSNSVIQLVQLRACSKMPSWTSKRVVNNYQVKKEGWIVPCENTSSSASLVVVTIIRKTIAYLKTK